MTTSEPLAPAVDKLPLLFAPEMPPRRQRFTLDGSEDLETRIATMCDVVLDGVQSIVAPSNLEALMLGGGYGRGEGGVLRSDDRDLPYNDLEFYVFVEGNRFFNRHRYNGALRHQAEALSRTVGIEVEFNIISLAYLQESSPSMFYYDLVMGHRWLLGHDHMLKDCEHHRDSCRLPVSEASRLLMNRGTGLLFAREKLEHGHLARADADFVARNLAKAQLAFGDAVLTAYGEYHWSCVERHHRLVELAAEAELPWLEKIWQHHAEGLEFKLHPPDAQVPVRALSEKFQEVSELALQVWLWLESLRLDASFDSIEDYYFSGKEIDRPAEFPWRNRLLNVRAFGPRQMFGRQARWHPREKVATDLAALLWLSEAGAGRLGRASRIERYRKAWDRAR